MSQPIRWAILGTGGIARKFAEDLKQTSSGELIAVGSRGDGGAQFAKEFAADTHGSYEDAIHADVDAVYNALPNTLHATWSLPALAAGKHVLCEKPIASTAKEAGAMFAAAGAAGKYLVEAFMYRHHPALKKLLSLVHDNELGRLKLIRANFTFQRPADRNDVRYQADLAGGALMDVGCYCINIARALTAAEPTEMYLLGRQHEFGVEDYACGGLRFPDDVLCSFTCGMTVQSDRRLTVAGDQGYIIMSDPWFTDGRFEMVRGDEVQQFHVPAMVGKYALEADEMAQLIRSGGQPTVTADDSIGNLRVLDHLRDILQA